MNDPKWIIRWQSETRGMLLLADYKDGSRRWAGFGYLFPTNQQYPDTAKLAHFKTQEEAEAYAFKRSTESIELCMVGNISAELCWIKRCKACYDCLCGEGNRRRE